MAIPDRGTGTGPLVEEAGTSVNFVHCAGWIASHLLTCERSLADCEELSWAGIGWQSIVVQDNPPAVEDQSRTNGATIETLASVPGFVPPFCILPWTRVIVIP